MASNIRIWTTVVCAVGIAAAFFMRQGYMASLNECRKEIEVRKKELAEYGNEESKKAKSLRESIERWESLAEIARDSARHMLHMALGCLVMAAGAWLTKLRSAATP